VEGANFDVRKHLLEYDDVLNTQRGKIYGQRNLIFVKDDLSEDVLEMLQTEVNRRVPEALKETEGAWKLLAWLDQIQPPFFSAGRLVPSFSLQLLVNDITTRHGSPLAVEDAAAVLTDSARMALSSEKEHILHTVNTLLDQTEDKLAEQTKERMDALDTFFEGLSLEDETDTRRPVDLLNELIAVVHIPIKLSNEQLRLLRNDPNQIAEDVRDAVQAAMMVQAITRLIGAVERRLEESLDISPAQAAQKDWNSLAETLMNSVETLFQRRMERYLGDGGSAEGQITHDIQTMLERVQTPIDDSLLIQLLMALPRGARASFDKKTHRRVWSQTTRLTYIYSAARFLDRRESEDITADVLAHLEAAQEAMVITWGRSEVNRLTSLGMFPPPTETKPNDELYATVGRSSLTEIYRQLLLNVITDLWVDYLTQMEALRISISLEAYAQRDPLVQYKNRAFGLFQDLLGNMRLGVVSRMFTFLPNESAAASAAQSARPITVTDDTLENTGAPDRTAGPDDGTGLSQDREVLIGDEVVAFNTPQELADDDGSENKKRRRRRH
jgi:preprotein translocase subunit SecA